MKKKENSRTVVVGGKADVRQQYCGAVGGQSADSDRIYSEQRVSRYTSFVSILRLMLPLFK